MIDPDKLGALALGAERDATTMRFLQRVVEATQGLFPSLPMLNQKAAEDYVRAEVVLHVQLVRERIAWIEREILNR